MIVNTENAEHYKWGNNCDGWHLLRSNTLSVIQERMPPKTSETLHYHDHSQQLFYILIGTATMLVDGVVFTVKANESIHIGQGKKHQLSNETDQVLEFLVISEPKSHGDRVESNS